MHRPSVLVVDDDPQIRQLLRLYLERGGYEAIDAVDGTMALDAARARTPDLILLDVMLPGVDGLEVCRRLRQETDVPIMLLTARSGDSDKVVGLDLGADDYIVKPFSPRELMARVRAQLRRRQPTEPRSPILWSDGIELDPHAVRVVLDGREVPLTASEFRILQALMAHPTVVMSRDQLIDALHGSDDPGIVDRTIDVHVGRLRQKLGDDADQPRFIGTIRSVGYRFLPSVERRDPEAAR